MSSPPRPNWGTRLSPARKAVTVVLMQHPAAFRHEASVWFGVGAPKSTPAGFVDKLNTEIDLGLADRDRRRRRRSDLRTDHPCGVGQCRPENRAFAAVTGGQTPALLQVS